MGIDEAIMLGKQVGGGLGAVSGGVQGLVQELRWRRCRHICSECGVGIGVSQIKGEWLCIYCVPERVRDEIVRTVWPHEEGGY
jgi:hypothetical protein